VGKPSAGKVCGGDGEDRVHPSMLLAVHARGFAMVHACTTKSHYVVQSSLLCCCIASALAGFHQVYL
jgi:hypothetical protein